MLGTYGRRGVARRLKRQPSGAAHGALPHVGQLHYTQPPVLAPRRCREFSPSAYDGTNFYHQLKKNRRNRKKSSSDSSVSLVPKRILAANIAKRNMCTILELYTILIVSFQEFCKISHQIGRFHKTITFYFFARRDGGAIYKTSQILSAKKLLRIFVANFYKISPTTWQNFSGLSQRSVNCRDVSHSDDISRKFRRTSVNFG